jgi:transcription-repair coupling factor (superfamily II helicase)
VLASDQAPRLAEILAEAGHPAAVVPGLTEAPPPGAIAIIERSLNGGFAGGPENLAFVTDRELFGNVRIRRPKAMRRVVPRDILERLTSGDFVVHIDHGVARFEQMLRRSASTGDERDFLELVFAGGDRIFVPVEQIGRVTRYSGGDKPHLSKLGGAEWLRTKQRVGRAVTDLAKELLELYAARSQSQGHAFAGDSPWQAELEASFPYEETVDQLRAVTEAKEDMERCPSNGPAGRGRRRLRQDEVALRAAFKATQDGKQVAVPGSDDGPRRPAPPDIHAALAAFPLEVRPACRGSFRRRTGDDPRRTRRRARSMS